MRGRVRIKKSPEVAELEERLAEAERRAVSVRARAVQDRFRAALAARRRLAQHYSLATAVGEVSASATQLSREVGPELSDAQVRVLSAPQRLSRSYWGSYLVTRDAYSLSLDELKRAAELLRTEVCRQDLRAAGILREVLRVVALEWSLPATSPEGSSLREDFRAVRAAWEERDTFARHAFAEVPR